MSGTVYILDDRFLEVKILSVEVRCGSKDFECEFELVVLELP